MQYFIIYDMIVFIIIIIHKQNDLLCYYLWETTIIKNKKFYDFKNIKNK